MKPFRIFLFGFTFFFINLVISNGFGFYNMQYFLKVVKEISDPSTHEGNIFIIKSYSTLNTDELKEETRIRLCEQALHTYTLSKRKIKLLSNDRTGKRTFLALDFSDANGRIEVEFVHAFSCPTQPPTYLQVQETDDIAWLIIKETELPPICDNSNNYGLKIVKKITDVDSLQALTFEHMAYPHLDLNTCTDQALLNMCKKALMLVNIPTKENIELLNDEKAKAAKFYGLVLKSEKPSSELVLAFECPTKPVIYLQTYKKKRTLLGITIREVEEVLIIIDSARFTNKR